MTDAPNPMTLEQFWDALAAWSQATFGGDQVRGPRGPLKHLLKELDELRADPADVEEHADVVFLIFDAARRAGCGYQDVFGLALRGVEIVDRLKEDVAAALETPDDPDWYRHLLQTAFALTWDVGISFPQLLAAIAAKLEKNKARTWPPPTADEPVEHVRDGADDGIRLIEAKAVTLLPAAPGTCPVCAVDHPPEMPHNAQSLYYQTRFALAHGRRATWADAVAHCPEPVREKWQAVFLATHPDRWTDPPAGVAPIAEPGGAPEKSP